MRALAALALVAAFAGPAPASRSPSQRAATLDQPRPGSREVLVQRQVYLMGTLAQLSTYAASRDAGLAVLETAVRVLEDAERELSTWRDDSPVSRLSRAPVGQPWRASARLCRLFGDLEDWHHATGGAFDPAIDALLTAWQIHGSARMPSEPELALALSRSGFAALALDRRHCTITRRRDVGLDSGGFGKGEALDRVAATLADTWWSIDLGGQVSVATVATRRRGWDLALAHPVERDRAFLPLRIPSGSLATSGGSERDAVVDGVRVGHILDPRTGRPAVFDGSVSVWHQSALVADVLSTALFVMGPSVGLRWAEQRGVSACYLIPDGGGVRVAMTSGFAPLVVR